MRRPLTELMRLIGNDDVARTGSIQWQHHPDVTDETSNLTSIHGPRINLFIEQCPSLGPVLELTVENVEEELRVFELDLEESNSDRYVPPAF